MPDTGCTVYHCYCFEPVNKLECCKLDKYLLHKLKMCINTEVPGLDVSFMCVFLSKASCYHASKERMIAHHSNTEEKQKQIKIQPSKVSKLTLTNASVVLLSFPMAQPAAGPQPPRLTAPHFTYLKDTNAEGPLTHDSSQNMVLRSLIYCSSHDKIRGLPA